MDKVKIYSLVNELQKQLAESCRFLWAHPEVGGTERQSSDYMRQLLREAGFTIHDVAEMPHAFYAEVGSGRPIIAIMGEYDALPGLSQQVCSEKAPVTAQAPGHGCGHNLLGSAAAIAAIAARRILEAEQIPGTLRFYGCPEEELLVGKVKMVYYHLFDDVDFALTWHPMTANQVYDGGALANASARFYFTGRASHAAVAPEKGRSALDAVELMNVGVNYLREHVIDKARIHYTTNSGGNPPNIVPDKADSWYYIRAPRMQDVKEILERVRKIAQGAALMTETEVNIQIESGCCEIRPNAPFADLLQANLEAAPLPIFSEAELRFARELQQSCDQLAVKRDKSLFGEGSDSPMMEKVGRRELYLRAPLTASTDVGDVSYVTPTMLFAAACWPLGTAPHSWQVTAANGSTLAEKGALYAARVLAASVYDLFTRAEQREAIRAAFTAIQDPTYKPMIFQTAVLSD